MREAKLVVKNTCPECSTDACVQFLTIDGKEVHVNCLECNKVYAARIPASSEPGDLKVITRWREVGSFVRL